ncbi:Nn.00g034720.m01.CDS01 [Neocucurbitaria sp. VM-36]
MSARGARSRKVQQKDIQKKEKKATGKGKASDGIYEQPHDAFADWRPTPSLNTPRTGVSRSITVSSNTSRTTSRSGGTNDSSSRPRLTTLHSNESKEMQAGRAPQSSGGASASVSDLSSKGKEKTKFQTHGKETKAPRGRGGGVPIKRNVAPSPAPYTFRTESAASYPLTNQKTWTNFRVWEGGRDGMRPYGGFDSDDDMQNGSVLVYFREEHADDDRPTPSIRAELDVLENSGSTWLSQLLLYSRVDDDVDEWELPNSPDSLIPSPNFPPDYSQPGPRRMLAPTSPGGKSPPPFDIDQTYARIDSRAVSRLQHFSEFTHSDRSESPPPARQMSRRNVTHEIRFNAPEDVRTAQGQRLHYVAIRNALAMLHAKPIVGADVFDMLSTLHRQIEIMYDLDSDDYSRMTPRERSIQMITNYLGQHGLDDVRKSIRQALGLLAWSEQDNVKWRQGYLESFVHLAGVMTPQVEDLAEFKRLSVVTRRNLGLTGKTLQLRVMEAEERLASFDFSDLWEDNIKAANSAVYQSYQSFRQFLVNHYTRIYGNWPPTTDKTWLNRKVVLAMQEDFGSLYDYLVNRDVVWNPREERASRKWEMAHRKNDGFKADLPELGITDMLVTFDGKYGYAHIPHPYPLLPREVPKASKEKEKKSIFDRMKKDKAKDSTKDAKAHLQLSIVFSDATNIEKLDVNFNGSTLIDKFEQFELTTDLKNTTPREARLGRWVLLYGILQVLSTLSVDVQGLKHTEGVRHFLCTDLKRCPEWVTNGQMEYLEATQHRSWCWQRSWDPMPTQTAPIELEASTAMDRTDAANKYERERSAEIVGHTHVAHGLPSPPPERSLPPPPSFDGATLMQNDIHRLSEKIDNYSLSHNATNIFRQEFERRRENEKVIQGEFHDRKPRLEGETFGPRATTTNNSNFRPRESSLPSFTNERSQSRLDDTYRLTESDFRDRQGGLAPPPPPPTLRSHVTSVNTDLGAYPFSPNEMQWPVPPGYEASHRGSTVVGSERGFSGDEERGGSGYGDRSARGVEEQRGARRVRERSGWN